MGWRTKRSAELFRLLSVGALALGVGNPAFDAARAATTAAVADPAATAAPQAPTPPSYAVVQGVHPETADVFQSLTILCPDKLKVFGAGFSAVVRLADQTKDGKPVYREEGLNDVRSVPDAQGAGWLIEGASPGAAATKQPWRLAGRVVCVRVGG